MIYFEFEGTKFPLEPKTAFFDYLYIKALLKEKELADQLLEHDAFTDIVFNPQKSINTQTRSAAIYVSLIRVGKLDEYLKETQAMITEV